MNKDSYKLYSNVGCPYYPCHDIEDFVSCMFCYCPLFCYDDCGGDYIYTRLGTKDCENCTIPHEEAGWNHVIAKLREHILNK